VLEIDDKDPSRLRRLTDRRVVFRLDLRFSEERSQRDGVAGPRAGATRTIVRVCISPSRTRDRRRQDVADRARDVVASFRSYLMATELEDDSPPSTVRTLGRARRLLMPWLRKRQQETGE